MKLDYLIYELLNNRTKSYIEPDVFEVSNQKDGIYLTLTPSYSDDKEVEIIYYWHHHMIDYNTRKNIQQAIDNHDFYSFMLYYDKLNTDNICYLPPIATILYDGKYVGWVALEDSYIFSMITYSECECG